MKLIRKFWLPIYIALSAFLVWYARDFAKRYKAETEERLAEEKLEREEELKRKQAELNRNRVDVPVETGVAPLP